MSVVDNVMKIKYDTAVVLTTLEQAAQAELDGRVLYFKGDETGQLAVASATKGFWGRLCMWLRIGYHKEENLVSRINTLFTLKVLQNTKDLGSGAGPENSLLTVDFRIQKIQLQITKLTTLQTRLSAKFGENCLQSALGALQALLQGAQQELALMSGNPIPQGGVNAASSLPSAVLPSPMGVEELYNEYERKTAPMGAAYQLGINEIPLEAMKAFLESEDLHAQVQSASGPDEQSIVFAQFAHDLYRETMHVRWSVAQSRKFPMLPENWLSQSHCFRDGQSWKEILNEAGQAHSRALKDPNVWYAWYDGRKDAAAGGYSLSLNGITPEMVSQLEKSDSGDGPDMEKLRQTALGGSDGAAALSSDQVEQRQKEYCNLAQRAYHAQIETWWSTQLKNGDFPQLDRAWLQSSRSYNNGELKQNILGEAQVENRRRAEEQARLEALNQMKTQCSEQLSILQDLAVGLGLGNECAAELKRLTQQLSIENAAGGIDWINLDGRNAIKKALYHFTRLDDLRQKGGEVDVLLDQLLSKETNVKDCKPAIFNLWFGMLFENLAATTRANLKRHNPQISEDRIEKAVASAIGDFHERIGPMRKTPSLERTYLNKVRGAMEAAFNAVKKA